MKRVLLFLTLFFLHSLAFAAQTNAPVGSVVQFDCDYPTVWNNTEQTPIDPGVSITIDWYVSTQADLSDATKFATNITDCRGQYTVQFYGKQYISAVAVIDGHPPSGQADPKEFVGDVPVDIAPMQPVITTITIIGQ